MNLLSSGLVTEVGVKILLKSIELFSLLSQCWIILRFSVIILRMTVKYKNQTTGHPHGAALIYRENS